MRHIVMLSCLAFAGTGLLACPSDDNEPTPEPETLDIYVAEAPTSEPRPFMAKLVNNDSVSDQDQKIQLGWGTKLGAEVYTGESGPYDAFINTDTVGTDFGGQTCGAVCIKLGINGSGINWTGEAPGPLSEGGFYDFTLSTPGGNTPDESCEINIAEATSTPDQTFRYFRASVGDADGDTENSADSTVTLMFGNGKADFQELDLHTGNQQLSDDSEGVIKQWEAASTGTASELQIISVEVTPGLNDSMTFTGEANLTLDSDYYIVGINSDPGNGQKVTLTESSGGTDS